MAKKKRYYQSAKDRKDESKGMRKRLGEAFYDGMKERARQEGMDASMIREDRGAIANMPQEVIMKQYPRAEYAYYGDLPDDIRGIDNQIRDDMKMQKKDKYPQKY